MCTAVWWRYAFYLVWVVAAWKTSQHPHSTAQYHGFSQENACADSFGISSHSAPTTTMMNIANVGDQKAQGLKLPVIFPGGNRSDVPGFCFYHFHLPARELRCHNADTKCHRPLVKSCKRQNWMDLTQRLPAFQNGRIEYIKSSQQNTPSLHKKIPSCLLSFQEKRGGGQTFNLLKKAVSFLHSWPFTCRGNADFLLSYGSDHHCQS